MRNLRLTRNIVLGVKTLMLHKLRSLLTTLGVVFGVASVIAMLAVGEGASAEAMEQLRRLGTHNIIINTVKPSSEDDAARQTQGQHVSVYGLKYDDDLRIRTLPTIERTAPARQFPVSVRMRDLAMDMRVVGTTPEWFELVDRPVIAGRIFTDHDMNRLASVAVLTEHGARRLFATGSTIGETIRIGGHAFRVIGIVQSASGRAGGVQTPDQPTDIYIPLNITRSRFGELIIQRDAGSRSMERIQLHQIVAQVQADADVMVTADAIRNMLERFRPDNDWVMQVPEALLQEAEATKRRFNIVLGAIAGISLLVGGIGIMNIMLASVTERTREIGIRRAIGAQRRQIVGQFLVETTVLSSIGGAIGIALGLSIPQLITYFAEMPTVVTAWSLALAVGISMTVGIVFGLYPAIRAANLDPITALRHE